MSLRNKLIRLAYQNPSLRNDLLPLITKSASIRITDTYSGSTVTVSEDEMLYFPLVKGSRITVVELPAREMIDYLKKKQGQIGPFTAYLDKVDAISDTKDALRRHSEY